MLLHPGGRRGQEQARSGPIPHQPIRGCVCQVGGASPLTRILSKELGRDHMALEPSTPPLLYGCEKVDSSPCDCHIVFHVHLFQVQVTKGLLPAILDELLTARKQAKRDMAAATDPMEKAVQNGRQLALKVTSRFFFFFSSSDVSVSPCSLRMSAAKNIHSGQQALCNRHYGKSLLPQLCLSTDVRWHPPVLSQNAFSRGIPCFISERCRQTRCTGSPVLPWGSYPACRSHLAQHPMGGTCCSEHEATWRRPTLSR